MTPLFVGFGLLAVGVFTMPVEQLPHTTAASFRALIGAAFLIAAGVCFGAFVRW